MFKISGISFSKPKIFQAKKLGNPAVTQPTELLRSPAADTFSSKILSENNDLIMTKSFLGGHFFREGKKNIGYADFRIIKDDAAPKEIFPADWFVKNGKPDANGNFPLKPYMYVYELFMNDRMGKAVLEKRDKKYGAMAMQHLLKTAYEQGCSSRITLRAGRLGRTEFYPGRFYHKMGFSLSPERIKEIESIEREMLQYGNTLEPLPQKIDGRYTEGIGKMFLTNPECIIKYPLRPNV